jgi:hypothetical protein
MPQTHSLHQFKNLASNSQIPHGYRLKRVSCVLHLMLLLHKGLIFSQVFTFSSEMKPWCITRCSYIFSAMLVPYLHIWHLIVPGSCIVTFWVLMSWISYPLPCSNSKSHSLQEKRSLALCSRLARFSTSLVDVATNSQSSQFICWLLIYPQVVPVLTSSASSSTSSHNSSMCIFRPFQIFSQSEYI